MTRLMALDVGEVRIGVAVSDSTGFLASPYTTLHVSRDETQTWAAIARLIDETEAEGLLNACWRNGMSMNRGKAIDAGGTRESRGVLVFVTSSDLSVGRRAMR